MVIPFQNEALLPKALDNETPIRGGSVGINEILGYLKDTATKRKSSQWKLFLLNAFTITRNVFTKDMSYPVFTEAFINECKLFQDYLRSYLSYVDHQDNRTYRYPVILYFPKYDKIPLSMRKHHPDSYRTHVIYYNKLKEHHANMNTSSHDDFIKFHIVSVGNTHLPFRELASYLRSKLLLEKDVLFNLRDPVFLLSHCVLDLYIHTTLPKVELVESYTAKIKTFKEFGSKLTSAVDIPFIWETHRLFGDGTHIEPLVKGQKKKLMIEVASKHKWIFKNSNMILNDIVNTLGVSRDSFKFNM